MSITKTDYEKKIREAQAEYIKELESELLDTEEKRRGLLASYLELKNDNEDHLVSQIKLLSSKMYESGFYSVNGNFDVDEENFTSIAVAVIICGDEQAFDHYREAQYGEAN